MSAESLRTAAMNFTLWGDNLMAGITVETADVASAIHGLKTAVQPDVLALPQFPDQIAEFLDRALHGDVYAAREFAETVNGYVAIGVRVEDNDDTSVMIMDSGNEAFTTLRRAANECDAFVIASLHHLGERCLQAANELELQAPQGEPEM